MYHGRLRKIKINAPSVETENCTFIMGYSVGQEPQDCSSDVMPYLTDDGLPEYITPEAFGYDKIVLETPELSVSILKSL
jgi:hypothetical protein